MTENKPQKIALAHDFLTVWGGAERVFRVMADMYPEAPIYTLYYDPALVRQHFPGREIRASFLQKLPTWLRTSFVGRAMYPVAVETLDFRDFDTVLSSSGAWMKGIVTRLHTRHIAYLHSPMRYAWDTFHTHPELATGFKFFQRLGLSYFRLWDKEAADRPDLLIVNSEYTRERVAKYYRREAEVVYPPVELSLSRAQLAEERTTFLVVARLSAAKHIDIVIEAFNKLGLPLTVVGTGPEDAHLRKLALRNISFLGAVDDARLAELYGSSRALIQASEEDFGLATAEALSALTPVIAYREGAVREIVTPGVTGECFDDLVPEAVADGVRRFIEADPGYDREAMRLAADRFARSRFEQLIRQAVS